MTNSESLWARTSLGAIRSIPEYVPVGLPEPQPQVAVELHGLGAPQDVTLNCAILALRPLTVGIGLDRGCGLADLQALKPRLVLRERVAEGRRLGRIDLKPIRSHPLPGVQLVHFETVGHANACLPAWQLWAFYGLRWWRSRGRRFNFRMRLAELLRQYCLYICPRPVVLVSTVHGEAGNLFPMDLMGPVQPGHFLLALRSTSPSVRLITEARRMALASVPADLAPVVYKLGRHHTLAQIDWMALPFACWPSPAFGLPVPEPALAVREVCVREVHTVGSHTVFITTVERETERRTGPRLCHISGLYQAFLERQGRPL